MAEKGNLAALLAGGGAFLIFLSRFFEGAADYALAGIGLAMVVAGLWIALKNRSIRKAAPSNKSDDRAR